MNTHPLALRARIVAEYEAGSSYQKLAERYNLHTSTVRSYVLLFRKTGSLAPRPHGGGRKRVLGTEQRDILKQLRQDFPQVRQQDLADRLFDATGVRLTRAALSRYLKELGFSRRSVRDSAKSNVSTAPKARREPRRYRKSEPPPSPPNRRAYPSDLTDTEWTLLEPLIPKAKSGGRKEEHPKREIVNAMLYLLRSGCQWRMLPHDLPPWQTVYNYYLEWRDNGLWERINQVSRERVRLKAGREATPSAAIVDSQSAKTTEKGGPWI